MARLTRLLLPFMFLVACGAPEPVDKSDIILPDGFKFEQLFSPGDHNMGSWVALAKDDKNRIIASDQYGDLYRFITPEYGDTLQLAEIEKIPLNIGYAQGLLWSDDALFVMVNRYTAETDSLVSGLYKLTDTNNDDTLDKIIRLQKLDGAGEHGPHSLIKGPDGLIYFVAGNHTLIPDSFGYIFPDNWGEDNILPVIKDPRGHANSIKAPGGWIARTDSDGSFFEVVAVGFRNTYDIAFNADGDLFAFDSDMEWDMGSPWYRPIRICHVIPGADFGWRTGSGKFPEYYVDSWPGVVDIGQGSPTGVLFTNELKFPEEYSNSLLAMDWSFGTMYSVSFQEEQQTFKGEVREFLARGSFPLTDMVAVNGDLYFTTGGRRLESGLYRVSYEGGNLGPISKDIKPFNRLNENTSLDQVWEELGSSNKQERYTARLKLEGLPNLEWIGRIATEDKPDIVIQSVVAVARITPPIDSSELLSWLTKLDIAGLSERQQLDLLRAYQLVIIRYGHDSAVDKQVIEALSKFYPGKSTAYNREMLKILAAVQDSTAIAKTLDAINGSLDARNNDFLNESTLERSEQYGDIISIIKRNAPETKLLSYLESLSVIQSGWTDSQKVEFFTLFNKIFTSTGGMSYKGFAAEILNRSLSGMSQEEGEKWRVASGVELMKVRDEDLADLPKPEGPGRIWTVEAASSLISSISGGDIKRGEEMFRASLCFSCHVVNEKGVPYGPDLSQLGSRFSMDDILKAIITPSQSITDQYAGSILTLKDGNTLRGRLIKTQNDTIVLNTNPFDPNQLRKIPVDLVASTSLDPVSSMPPGLLNRLNEAELRDLLLFLSELKD